MSTALQCEFWAVGQGLFSSGKVLSGATPLLAGFMICQIKSDLLQ
ncbi:hypothetical protein ACWIUH_00465 [Ursidibacter arcticus]